MKKSLTYSDKLKDPRWQKKRLEIFNRDEFSCQRCGRDTVTLHVHHKFYEKGLEPWEYDNRCYVTLCEDCHEQETNELAQYAPLFIETFKRSEFFADDLRELAQGISEIKLLHLPGVVASAFRYAMQNKELQRYLIQAYFDRNKSDNPF